MIDVDLDRRWWIGEGDERCPFCLQGYALELEVRCVDCDAPGCPHCMVHVRERAFTGCPDCGPEPEERPARNAHRTPSGDASPGGDASPSGDASRGGDASPSGDATRGGTPAAADTADDESRED